MPTLTHYSTKPPTVEQLLDVLRSPARDLGERLSALDGLMRPGLSAEHKGSRQAYEPILINEVKARGEVRFGGLVYKVSDDGKILRRLP